MRELFVSAVRRKCRGRYIIEIVPMQTYWMKFTRSVRSELKEADATGLFS